MKALFLVFFGAAAVTFENFREEKLSTVLVPDQRKEIFDNKAQCFPNRPAPPTDATFTIE